MTKNRASIFTMVLIIAVFAVSGMASAAREQTGMQVGYCPEVPQTKWWGKTTHQKITNYVTKKHNGNWMPYIDKWNRQLAKMRTIYHRGGSAVFKKQGVTIEDKQLSQYIKDIEVRLEVTRCLAMQELKREEQLLSEMETASGEDEPAAKNE